MTVIRAACVQLNVGPEVGPNLAAAGALIRDAASRGATLIALPEVADAIIEAPALLRDRAQPEQGHEALAGYRALARETGTTLLLGSVVGAIIADLDLDRAARAALPTLSHDRPFAVMA